MSDSCVSAPAVGIAGGQRLSAVIELGAATASLGQPFGVGGLGAASSPTATVLTFPVGRSDRHGRRTGSSRDGEHPHEVLRRSSVPASRAVASGALSDGGERPVLAGGDSERWSSPLAPWRIRTLRYIAAHPGAGSREIAASGDCPCQASTLLRRMEELDFVEHMPRQDASRRAWHLTAHGHLAVTAAERPRSHLVAV